MVGLNRFEGGVWRKKNRLNGNLESGVLGCCVVIELR